MGLFTKTTNNSGFAPKCAKCGAVLLPDSAFCIECGTPTAPPAGAPTAAAPPPGMKQKQCPSCKSMIDDDSNFCCFCGHVYETIMNRCPSCNAILPDNADKCAVCGAVLRKSAPVPKPIPTPAPTAPPPAPAPAPAAPADAAVRSTVKPADESPKRCGISAEESRAAAKNFHQPPEL